MFVKFIVFIQHVISKLLMKVSVLFNYVTSFLLCSLLMKFYTTMS